MTVTLCSAGSEGASGGSADENDHSSSSAVVVAAGAGGAAIAGVADLGVDGLEEESWADASAAKGSFVVFCCGGGWENADCCSKDGCGVDDCEVEGWETKPEKGEKGGGVGDDTGPPPALLFWVMDDSKAGPGISRSRLVIGT